MNINWKDHITSHGNQRLQMHMYVNGIVGRASCWRLLARQRGENGDERHAGARDVVENFVGMGAVLSKASTVQNNTNMYVRIVCRCCFMHDDNKSWIAFDIIKACDRNKQ